MLPTNGVTEMSNHQSKIKIFYDQEVDVLYVTRGNPEYTDYVEYAEDIILRFHPETKELGSVYIFLAVISIAAKWTNPRYRIAYLS